MKKKFWIGLLSIILLTGCNTNISNEPKKTTYNINEEAFLDHFQIICTDFKLQNQSLENTSQLLKVNYTVTNNSDQKTQINLKKDFQLYTDNKDLINSISEEIVSLNASETKEIEVLFNINNDSQTENSSPYTVIFYSNVATNNIGFILE